MLKRRPLGNNNNNGKSQNTPHSQGPGSQNPQSPQAPQRPQGPKPQGQHKQQQRPPQQGQGQNQNRRSRHGGGHRRPPQRPQPPPAYLQRDLLLMPTRDTSLAIEEVRNRFDPLSKKISAHVTIILPEPAAKINRDILKKHDVQGLPSLKTLTFTSIQVVDDIYLWLIPDEESAQKLKAWHEVFSKNITEHTQGEKYEPHVTLGYVPRKVPEEEALAFAKNLITTPHTMNFEMLLLEEFSEDQQSRSLDRLQILH